MELNITKPSVTADTEKTDKTESPIQSNKPDLGIPFVETKNDVSIPDPVIPTNEPLVTFACDRFSGFMFRAGTKRYRFQRHALKVPESEAQEIRDLLNSNLHLGRMIREVSISQAEALVKAHMASHGGAAKGPLNTEVMREAEMLALNNRDAQFANLDNQADIIQQLQQDGLTMTETVKPND